MYNPTKPYKDKIIRSSRKTWITPYIVVQKNIYPIFHKKFNYLEVSHTDGIGTKGIYHWRKKTYKNAVLDALAMNLNDLALTRAVPYSLQNHITIPEDNHEAITEIIGYLSSECRKRNIAITGGETSIHDNAEGLDISMTISGFIPKIKPNQFRINDILIGIRSSGLHSNGFTKVREVFGKKLKTEFTIPTKIYLDAIFKLDKEIEIHGMMHITGGAFTKLKQVLPKNCDTVINKNHGLKPHKIFYELYRRGISDEEMYKTFNCGVGFVFSITPKDAKKILPGKDIAIIGQIVVGKEKIKIESMFSDKIIEY